MYVCNWGTQLNWWIGQFIYFLMIIKDGRKSLCEFYLKSMQLLFLGGKTLVDILLLINMRMRDGSIDPCV